MANPQCENGYTKIANELLEELLLYKFPPNTSDIPLKIVLFVIRKTYGFNKKKDDISITQFEENTLTARKQVCYWLGYLVTAKILVKAKTLAKQTVSYSINKDYEQWVPLVTAKKLVTARSFTSNSQATRTSNSQETHKRKKENYKRNKELVYSENSLKICSELGITPKPIIEKYVTELYPQYSFKDITITCKAWCDEKRMKPSSMRWKNFVDKAIKNNQLPKRG